MTPIRRLKEQRNMAQNERDRWLAMAREAHGAEEMIRYATKARAAEAKIEAYGLAIYAHEELVA